MARHTMQNTTSMYSISWQTNLGQPLCSSVFLLYDFTRCIGVLRNSACSTSRLVSCTLSGDGRNYSLFIAGGNYRYCASGLSSMHLNHLFIWMDPEVVAHDKLIAGKTGYLNTPFFLARAVFFLAGWSLYRFFSRKFSLAQDEAKDISNHKKNFQNFRRLLGVLYSNRIHYGLGLDYVHRPALVQHLVWMVCLCEYVCLWNYSHRADYHLPKIKRIFGVCKRQSHP